MAADFVRSNWKGGSLNGVYVLLRRLDMVIA